MKTHDEGSKCGDASAYVKRQFAENSLETASQEHCIPQNGCSKARRSWQEGRADWLLGRYGSRKGHRACSYLVHVWTGRLSCD